MARIKYYNEATGQWRYADVVISGGSGSAPPYVLPVADDNTLGGILADAQLDADTQPVRIGTDKKLYTKPGAGSYTLPAASPSELGGVKTSALDPKTNAWFQTFIDGAGKLHTLTHAAESDTFGCIKADEAPLTATEPIYIGKDGKLKYIPQEIPIPPAPYELPVAAAATLGGIKADAKRETDTQPVRIGPDNKLYTAPGSSKSEITLLGTFTLDYNTSMGLPSYVKPGTLLYVSFNSSEGRAGGTQCIFIPLGLLPDIRFRHNFTADGPGVQTGVYQIDIHGSTITLRGLNSLEIPQVTIKVFSI